MTYDPRRTNPGYEVFEDLETRVSREEADVIYVLEGQIHDAGPVLGFVDQSVEFEHPDTIRYVERVVDVLNVGYPAEAALQAGYQGFHYAYTLGSLVLPKETGLLTDGFFDDAYSYQGLRDKLTATASVYLGERETLDSLTRRFMPTIDASGRCGHIAEVVASTTLLFIDQAEAVRVAIENHEAQVNNFDIGDFLD